MSSRHTPHNQRPPRSQPSPYKLAPTLNLINTSPSSSRPSLHHRSQSHNTYSPSHSYDPGLNGSTSSTNLDKDSNWTAFIPPLPKNDAPNSDLYANNEFSFSSSFQEPAPKPQRHSIASASPTPPPPSDSSAFSGPAHSYTYPKPSQATSSTSLQTPHSSTNPFVQPNSYSARKDAPPFIQHQLAARPPRFTSKPSYESTSSSNRDTPNASRDEFHDPTHPNNSVLSTKRSIRKKKAKTCKKCGLDITGQFVRALSSAFHVECFCCNECGKQCSSKFFPYEMVDKSTKIRYQVALCEYDYFKKLDLICCSCNSALRGPYITALGKKYHLEHFKCAICQKVFESDESYYEHEGNIYCHFHYSKLYAAHCEGCNSSIVKQFVELFRGGRNQQWHPECYMVHKFWNVCVVADSVGLNQKFKSLELNDTNNDSASTLIEIEEYIENTVMKCWVSLSGYEELTASCISDMLLNACVGNQFSGLISTGRLIVCIEVLFNAIDYIQDLYNSMDQKLLTKIQEDQQSSDQNEAAYQPLRKEPRNLSGKVMSYLAILRKSNHISTSGSLSAELLSVITGCAHYLKLLIRIGLQNSLRINKLRDDSIAIDTFLLLVKKYEDFSSTKGQEDKQVRVIQNQLSIPLNSTDACEACSKSIERSCIKFNDKRWHIKCFKCSKTSQEIPKEDIANSRYNTQTCCIISPNHLDGVPEEAGGFEFVTDLAQLSYLLKIAFLRSKQVMALDYKEQLSKKKDAVNMAKIEEDKEAFKVAQSEYSSTLNDVTKLRTKRQSQKLSSSVKKNARKSVIIEAPTADIAKSGETNEDELGDDSLEVPQRTANDRKASVGSTSQKSFVTLQNDSDHFNLVQRQKSLRIRDEPQRQVSTNHLSRTSDLLKNEKSLTLDDIPRIVAAEQARDQRPNAFKHHNSLYQRAKPTTSTRSISGAQSLSPSQFQGPGTSPNLSTNANEHENDVVIQPSKYYSELDKSEHYILRLIAIEALAQLTNNKYSKLELLNIVQVKKPQNFWDKFKIGGDKKDKVHGVFGVNLPELVKKNGIDSDLGVGPSKLRIPIVIEELINSLKTKDMSVEGIFRLNGNIKRLRELTEQINQNPLKTPNFTNQTAVQLAALMKKWLRELPNPLLTFNLYDLWIESQKESDPLLKKRLMKLVYCLLPRSHRSLVEVLLYFFNWVASFAEIDEENGSKMDVHNLATVIAPNILYSKESANHESNLAQGDSHFLAIEVVNQLIEMHEELSVIPVDLLEFFDQCSAGKTDVSTKEILQRIEKVTKEHPNFFRNFDVKDETLTPSNQEVKSNIVFRGHSRVLNEQHSETTII